MTNGITDPAEQWSDLLSSLTDRRREAVVAALRSSAEQGWPADREAVRLLVAYANGEIDAQDYAVGIVMSLGGLDQPVQQAAVQPAQELRPSRPTAEVWSTPTEPARPEPLQSNAVTSLASQPSLTREEAVAAYVSGRIPVEEFLRITRGVSA
jgi:hypothetical protein